MSELKRWLKRLAASGGIQSGEELGRGGMGIVLSARDPEIGREVAVKVLRDGRDASDEEVRRLITEIQIMGQLEHPNIVPVYRVGLQKGGELYFSMRRVRRNTLSGLLKNLSRGRGEYNRLRMLRLFMQICMAVEFAHSRGVIHRDLKTENIMLGEYEEAFVMDWGLAIARPDMEGVNRPVELDFPPEITDGLIVGTPACMSPEQAKGQVSRVDRRSDVFALGAVLFELLTLTPLIRTRDVFDALEEVRKGDFERPSERAPSMEIPADLDEICQKALAYNQEDRYASAKALHADVEAFFEGSVASERRRKEALERIREGDGELETFKARRMEKARIETKILAVTGKSQGKLGLVERQSLWELEDRLQDAEREAAAAFNRTLNLYQVANTLEPENRAARKRLGTLYWMRYLDAERQKDPTGMMLWMNQVQRVNDGDFDERIRGEGRLAVESDPPGATLSLYAFRKRQRELKPELLEISGVTPISEWKLCRGGYLLVLRKEGFADTRIPVFVERMETVHVRVRLMTPERLGEGFRHIPAGPVVLGGEPDTFGSWEERTVDLPDFALATFPVTMKNYCAFLNDRDYHDAEAARLHAPRLFGSEETYLVCGPDDLFDIPEEDAEGDRWLLSWPVIGVNHADALAYIAWRSKKDGVRYRLPTDEEWEKAARGADRRRYPWGDSFDPSFCNMRDSFDKLQLKPVGSFPKDRSPYDVRDLGGNVRDWTSDRVDAATENITVRGGAWSMYEIFSRSACRAGAPKNMCAVNIGFRLAKDL